MNNCNLSYVLYSWCITRINKAELTDILKFEFKNIQSLSEVGCTQNLRA